MFTGIVERAKVASAQKRGPVQRVRIGKPHGWKLAEGESVAVDGICSTVVALSGASFDVEYMLETLSRTTARSFARGTEVNVERSLTFGDRVHGHFVAGHVDACGRVEEANKGVLSVTVPRPLMRFIAPKGSITVNGVALTVTTKSGAGFSVALIPYTLAHTNLGTLARGDSVNIEIDLLARYMDVLLKKR